MFLMFTMLILSIKFTDYFMNGTQANGVQLSLHLAVLLQYVVLHFNYKNCAVELLKLWISFWKNVMEVRWCKKWLKMENTCLLLFLACVCINLIQMFHYCWDLINLSIYYVYCFVNNCNFYMMIFFFQSYACLFAILFSIEHMMS